MESDGAIARGRVERAALDCAEVLLHAPPCVKAAGCPGPYGSILRGAHPGRVELFTSSKGAHRVIGAGREITPALSYSFEYLVDGLRDGGRRREESVGTWISEVPTSRLAGTVAVRITAVARQGDESARYTALVRLPNASRKIGSVR